MMDVAPHMSGRPAPGGGASSIELVVPLGACLGSQFRLLGNYGYSPHPVALV